MSRARARGRLSIPAGAELAVAQHLQDLLESKQGAELVAIADSTGECEELAVFLANALINGVDVDVVHADHFEPEHAPRRRWDSPR